MSPQGVVLEQCLLRAVGLGGKLCDSDGAESCYDFCFPDTISATFIFLDKVSAACEQCLVFCASEACWTFNGAFASANWSK